MARIVISPGDENGTEQRHRSGYAQGIMEIANGQVTFEYYDNRDKDETNKGKRKQMTLSAVEFIRRFLLHVLPKGFIRIRHYGLYASGMRLKLQAARLSLGQSFELPNPPKIELSEWLTTFAEGDPFACPFCGVGRMRIEDSLLR